MTEAPDIVWPADTVPAEHHEPHNAVRAAERAVLGAALLSPGIVPEVAAILRDDDWSWPAHCTVWQAITDRAATGQPVDVLSIAHDVARDRTLSQLGGALYVNELANDPAVAPSSATYHAQIIANAAQARRTQQLGTWLAQAGETGLDEQTVRERIEKYLADRNPAVRGAANTWDLVDLGPVLDGTAPDTRPSLMPRSDGPCLLYPGAVHLLSGEPTSGKTWLALDALLAELKQGLDVALIDFEDRAGTATSRLLALGATPDQLRAHLRYVRPEVALDAAGRAALANAVTGTSLTVIDGVTEAMTMHGLDLSSNPDVATFYALLPRFVAGQGCAVVLIDHVVKNTEQQGRWSIGGQHKVAGIDGAAYTVRNVIPFGRGKAGHSRVFIAKDRHGHIEEAALGRCAAEFHLDSTDPDVSRARLDPPEAMPTTEDGDMRPTYLMEKVSRYLEINPGSSLNDVKRAKLGGKSTYVAKALQTLVTEGYVRADPAPRGGRFHTSIEPFRRDQERVPVDDEGWPTQEPPL